MALTRNDDLENNPVADTEGNRNMIENARLSVVNRDLKRKNKVLIKEYKFLKGENIILRIEMAKLHNRIKELEINHQLQRHVNPGLNTNGFFSATVKKDNNPLVEELNALLIWVCEIVHRSISSLVELDANLKNELYSHPDYQLELHGKVFPSKLCIILPVLIGPDGQVKELGFLHESCVALTEIIIDLFKLSTQLKRCNTVNQDNPNSCTQYQIVLTEEAINVLRERKQSFLQQLKVQ